MPGFPPITVRHPRPFDIVDNPIEICGVGTGFEGVISARVRDGDGTELMVESINAGGTGIWGNFHKEFMLLGIPSATHGTLEVFEFSQSGDGSQLNTVVVPIIFGGKLIHPYHGFAQYTVVPGDTLSAIAGSFYGDPNLWPRLFDANRDQIIDPNLIFPGQVLRIPQ
jgi:nucleoid-associated protein YgaU